jgi:hypothetical protein
VLTAEFLHTLGEFAEGAAAFAGEIHGRHLGLAGGSMSR